jgi:hypothetical protein
MPNFRIVDSSSSVDRNPYSDFPFKIKPDISVYPDTSDLGVRTDTSLVEIFIEFKWKSGDDPFCAVHDINDSDGRTRRSFLHETHSANDTLGQITSYAAAQLSSQFRTHAYSVIIVKDTARILQWDRSSAIVTEAIEYNKSPLLTEFFRRYSKAPPDMRGIDQSASVPTCTEAIVARQALRLDNTVPLVKLEIPDISGAPRYFITHTPQATLYTLPGCATRDFEAYNVLQVALVFLKDSWRVDLPDIWAEGLTYRTPREKGVRNVPQCIASGDISSAKYHAKTSTYSTKHWACDTDAHFIPHRHHHLALDIIGHSLTKFKSSYEMVAAVHDALIGKLPDTVENQHSLYIF